MKPSEIYLLDVITGRRKGIAPTLIRWGLSGLALLYSSGLKLYLLPYQTGVRRQAKLACPVISIGNLTVGGTGKTPVTQVVCELLEERGKRVCVLSRGYRGRHEDGAAVISTREGITEDSATVGDEAYMLARRLPGVPVVVGKDRRKTGTLAVSRFMPDVIVLDDGMQFYQLHRDLDVVLVDARWPFHNGWTFPRGLLREPPSHLKRAGCIIITNEELVTVKTLAKLRHRLARLAPKAPIFTANYVATSVHAVGEQESLGTAILRGKKVASLCALGSPEGFEHRIGMLGAILVHRTRFPDHHVPSSAELSTAAEIAESHGAQAVIITEKDAVKLRDLPDKLPWYALEARMLVDDEPHFAEVLMEAVAA